MWAFLFGCSDSGVQQKLADQQKTNRSAKNRLCSCSSLIKIYVSSNRSHRPNEGRQADGSAPVQNHFTVSRISEAGVLWCRFRDQKEIPGEVRLPPFCDAKRSEEHTSQ